MFLGSKRYPYKGLLDKMANRCFAQGTNAWTDTDHTCYTLTTAGRYECALFLLPLIPEALFSCVHLHVCVFILLEVVALTLAGKGF